MQKGHSYERTFDIQKVITAEEVNLKMAAMVAQWPQRCAAEHKATGSSPSRGGRIPMAAECDLVYRAFGAH